MEQNNQRNSRKRLNSLILLVAFTAVMLIVSTYAWFSTQKNVTLGGLKGKVNVAEGLQISLDAVTWKNEIDLAAVIADATTYFQTGYNMETPYEGGSNILPDELLPVSTTAKTETEAIGLTKVNMYAGENTDGNKLKNITEMAEEKASGYFAIDFFLQNSSASGVTTDPLRLESNSELTLWSEAKETTGLQNTVRVAFALFDNNGSVPVDGETTSSEIIAGTTGSSRKITDVAIWEPNSDAHVDQIVKQYEKSTPMTWSAADATAIFSDASKVNEPFAANTKIPTYALTAASAASTLKWADGTTQGIENIYDWSGTHASLVKQLSNQTLAAGFTDPVQLKSATDGSTDFAIAPNQYHRLRMYVWLEGQDVDCINYASLGGGIELDIGLSKEGSSNS